jgi:hypothetical protein
MKQTDVEWIGAYKLMPQRILPVELFLGYDANAFNPRDSIFEVRTIPAYLIKSCGTNSQ